MTAVLVAAWVRRGAAAGIVEVDPLAGAYAGPANFAPSVVLARDGQAQPALAGPALPLLGPGSVVGLDRTALRRTDPPDGATGVEDNYLPLIELSRADLPWLFTPARPTAADRLRPWLVLVVVEAAQTALQPGTPLPRITVNDGELPDLDDSWGWAHAQVSADDAAGGQAALQAPEGAGTLSRLLCPRRLQPDTAYLACLVPATRAGALAGLGLPADPGPALPMAWQAGAGQTVTLPVYHAWRFATGAAGDFKSLVQRLRGVRPDSIPGFGTRAIDVSAPWAGGAPLGQGLTTPLDGALGIGGADAGWTSDAAVRSAFEGKATALLDFPADRQPANVADPSLSAVGPPIYGGRAVGAVRVPATAGWLRTLNLDPRRRMAAALGANYVRDHQEFLMARAWEQLGAVREANRVRALGEMAAVVADRLHARHIAKLGASELVSLAGPARTRLRVAPVQTLQAATAASPLAAGAQTPAFNRFARPQGPLGRRAYGRAAPTIVERGLANLVRIAPQQLDGIATLAPAPSATVLAKDATGLLVSRAWQALTVAEQGLSNPANLQQLRIAQGAAASPPAAPSTWLGGVLPVVLSAPPPGVAVAAASLATTLVVALQPSASIAKRIAARVRVPPVLAPADPTAPVMAGPSFPAPLVLGLLQDHPEIVLPGLGNFPDDRVTLMVANAPFIEALLVGANHEMNRELLWREYPTDQRGTPFRWFWPRPDGQPEIAPIAAWPAANALGANGHASGADVENMVVLLVRGELLRRYPQTMAYAAPGAMSSGVPTLDSAAAWTAPQVLLKIDATTSAYAFPLTAAQLRSDRANGVPGWYFVFSEALSSARFNFDDAPTVPLTRWTDLDWAAVPQSRGFAIAGAALATPSGETAADAPRWNRDAADMARIAYARPFRVAYHADELLAAP